MDLGYATFMHGLRATRLQRECDALLALPPLEQLAQLAALARHLPASDWLFLLGTVWSGLPRLAGWEDYLLMRSPLASAPWPVIEMMDADELASFEALPDEFLVYRGALAHNHAGLCWCLDMGQAAAYADCYARRFVQFGHSRPTAYRLTARVDKSHVIAVKRIDGALTLLVAQVDYLDTEVLPAPSFTSSVAVGR